MNEHQTIDMVGPDEIAAWRTIYANRCQDLVPEIRRAAFQQIVICDLALDGLKYRTGERPAGPERGDAMEKALLSFHPEMNYTGRGVLLILRSCKTLAAVEAVSDATDRSSP